ncbi:MAG: hypothetical protein RLZZ361_147 [Cyanobacteriota bacterium]|jgi:hypothetical protein
MSIITNYDRWQADYKPKLKANLDTKDKKQDFYKTNAIGIQVNGSTVSLGLLDHLGNLIQIPVLKNPQASRDQKEDAIKTCELQYRLNLLEISDQKEAALKTLFQMVADVVKYQKSQDPNGTIDIDISAAGFAPKSHPVFFTAKGLDPVDINGLTYMTNFPAITIDQSVKGLNGDYEKSKFHNFQARLKTALGEHININYQDEASDTKSTQAKKGFTVNMTTMNDTNTLAFQLGHQLNQSDTVIGVVGGTGFNVGVNKSYDGKGSFDSISNLECGGTVLPEKDLLPFLSPIDRFKLQAEPNTPPEWFFAGGQEDQGLVNIAKKIQEDFRAYSQITKDHPEKLTIYDRVNGYPFAKAKSRITNFALEYLCYLQNDKKFDLKLVSQIPTWLTGSETLTNRLIMQKARENEPLALAMVNDFASRWGGFIKNRLDDKGLLNGVDNPKYAITGSHLQDLLSIKSAKTAFAEALGVSEANLINIEKSEMDGMQAILKAKIATARAAV